MAGHWRCLESLAVVPHSMVPPWHSGLMSVTLGASQGLILPPKLSPARATLHEGSGCPLSHSQLLCSWLEAAGLCLGLLLAEHSFGLWQLLGRWSRLKFGTLVDGYQWSTSFDYSHWYYCLFHSKLLKFLLINIARPMPGSLPINLRPWKAVPPGSPSLRWIGTHLISRWKSAELCWAKEEMSF